MKIIFLILLTVCFSANAQTPAYYHDTTLDSINGSASHIDSSINYYGQQQLTISNVNAYNGTQYSNNLAFFNNTVISSNLANANALISAFSNVLGGAQVSTNFTTLGTATSTVPVSASVINLGNYYLNPLTPSLTRTFSIDFSISTIPPALAQNISLFRNLLLIFIYISLFVASFKYLQGDFVSSMNQKQISGLNQQIFGNNAVAPTALVYAAIVISTFVALLAVVVSRGFVKDSFSYISKLLPALEAIKQIPGFDVCMLAFPIPEALTAYFTYLAFRYIFCFPLFLAVRCAQIFMIR